MTITNRDREPVIYIVFFYRHILSLPVPQGRSIIALKVGNYPLTIFREESMKTVKFTEKEKAVLRQAEIIYARKLRTHTIQSAEMAGRYCQAKLAHSEREIFAVLLVDSQHQVIDFVELFKGTINAAAVYPREIVKLALEHNAAACLLCHNHPSNVNQPSDADIRLTKDVTAALQLIDVQVLDHFIVSASGFYSFAQHGRL